VYWLLSDGPVSYNSKSELPMKIFSPFAGFLCVVAAFLLILLFVGVVSETGKLPRSSCCGGCLDVQLMRNSRRGLTASATTWLRARTCQCCSDHHPLTLRRCLYPVHTIKLARRAAYILAGRASSMFARCLLDVCSTSARRLLDVCLMFARSCKRGIKVHSHCAS